MAFPSPLVMLSVIAIAMAAVAFVLTRNPAPTEREITPASRQTPAASPSGSPKESASPSASPKKKPKVVDRAAVMVEVYNNSGIAGLAGETASKASQIGWNVTGSDNWYGTIPASTVYYPAELRAAARQLGLDLGIARRMPVVGDMRTDRLTVVLTADYR